MFVLCHLFKGLTQECKTHLVTCYITFPVQVYGLVLLKFVARACRLHCKSGSMIPGKFWVLENLILSQILEAFVFVLLPTLGS